MKVKPKVLITTIVTLIMVAVIIYSFVADYDLIPKNNIWTTGGVNSSPTAEVPSKDNTHERSAVSSINSSINSSDEFIDNHSYSVPSLEDYELSTIRILFATKKGRTVQMNEGISMPVTKLNITANKVTITKKRLYPVDSFMPKSYLKVNEHKDILNEYSYFIVTITAKNELNEENAQYMSCCQLYFQTGEEKVRYCELWEYTGKKSAKQKNYFEYVFAPLETRTFDLIYYVPDELIDTALSATLLLYTAGPLVHDDARFIDLTYTR